MSRNSEVLASFVEYCVKHPDERFWQALRNWSKYGYIYASNDNYFAGQNGARIVDTFYWEGENNAEEAS